MPNLIDKLTTKVDNVRQKAADKFGLPAYNMFRVIRTWSGGELGLGSPVDVETLMTPTPKIVFEGDLRLDPNGLVDARKMTATQISLTFTENFLQGDPKSAGQECFYKLVERNSQSADTTYWTLINVPVAMRNKLGWQLECRAKQNQSVGV